MTTKLQADGRARRYDDIRQLIASPEFPTPLLRVNNVLPPGSASFYLKLEWFNPFGSIKDRTALYLLNGLLERGELEGKSLVEPTSGNTGIALAAIAALMSKEIALTVPDGVPEEKKVVMRMLGAEVWETPDDLCPIDHPKDGAIALAHSLVDSPANEGKYVMPNQYANTDNVKAHYETTGPEIWRQTNGQVRYFFAGYGTCGTISGVAKYLKEQKPDIQVIAVEPQKGHRLPGLKNLQESKAPEILDRDAIDEVIRVDDGPAYEMTRRLFKEEGLIIGPSTGAIAYAAGLYLQGREGIGVGISPDGGFKYGSYFTDLLGNEGNPTA